MPHIGVMTEYTPSDGDVIFGEKLSKLKMSMNYFNIPFLKIFVFFKLYHLILMAIIC